MDQQAEEVQRNSDKVPLPPAPLPPVNPSPSMPIPLPGDRSPLLTPDMVVDTDKTPVQNEQSEEPITCGLDVDNVDKRAKEVHGDSDDIPSPPVDPGPIVPMPPPSDISAASFNPATTKQNAVSDADQVVALLHAKPTRSWPSGTPSPVSKALNVNRDPVTDGQAVSKPAKRSHPSKRVLTEGTLASMREKRLRSGPAPKEILTLAERARSDSVTRVKPGTAKPKTKKK